ncbi:MAG: ABC transporter permease [Actinobacteria bacterium]|nr:ABC transporter permease [Actinomycetota bacterium]
MNFVRLYHITWKNIKTHPAKVALLVAGLAVGVAVIVGLYTVSRAMHMDLQDKIDEYGANMVITPKSESLPLTYAGVTVGGLQYGSHSLTEKDLEKIRTIEESANVKVVSPKLLGIVEVNGSKTMLAGVRFKDEFDLKKWWEIKQGVRPANDREILLGGKAARRLGAGAGDSLNISGEEFRVAGVLGQVGTEEDELIFIGMKQAQAILERPGEVSFAEVSAWCKDCPIDDIVEQVREKLPGAKVAAVRQAAETRDAVIGQFSLFSLILSVTMGIVAALVVFTNTLSAVRERRREIGVFRAVGYRRSHIALIVLLESAIVGLVAGVGGYLAGFSASGYIAPIATGMDVGVVFDPIVPAIAIGGVVVLSLLAGVYPATVAARLDPSEALNSIT